MSSDTVGRAEWLVILSTAELRACRELSKIEARSLVR